MDFLNDFLSTYGYDIIKALFVGFFGYLGVIAKNLYTEHVNTKTKKDVVKTCVGAVEQIYKDLHGEEKLNEATKAASEMLAEKGIKVTDLELRMLIESALSEFNNSFNSTTSKSKTKATK